MIQSLFMLLQAHEICSEVLMTQKKAAMPSTNAENRVSEFIMSCLSMAVLTVTRNGRPPFFMKCWYLIIIMLILTTRFAF